MSMPLEPRETTYTHGHRHGVSQRLADEGGQNGDRKELGEHLDVNVKNGC